MIYTLYYFISLYWHVIESLMISTNVVNALIHCQILIYSFILDKLRSNIEDFGQLRNFVWYFHIQIWPEWCVRYHHQNGWCVWYHHQNGVSDITTRMVCQISPSEWMVCLVSPPEWCVRYHHQNGVCNITTRMVCVISPPEWCVRYHHQNGVSDITTRMVCLISLGWIVCLCVLSDQGGQPGQELSLCGQLHDHSVPGEPGPAPPHFHQHCQVGAAACTLMGGATVAWGGYVNLMIH